MLAHSHQTGANVCSHRQKYNVGIKETSTTHVSYVWLKTLISLFLLYSFCGTLEANDIRISGLIQRQANPVPVGTSIDYSLTIRNVNDGVNQSSSIGVGIRFIVDGVTIRADSGEIQAVGCSVDHNFPSDFACYDLSEGGSQTPTFTWLNPTPGDHTVTLRSSCQLVPAQTPPVYCPSFGASLSTTTSVGQNPVAVLNPQGPVTIDGPEGFPIIFDGVSSSDPDGTVATCAFSLDGGAYQDSPDCSIEYTTLPPGEYELRLVVTDNDGLTSMDSALIQVIGGPTADAGPDQQVTDSDGNGSEDVILDASGSINGGGNIINYVWSESNNQIATGATPTVPLSVGTHTLTLWVMDDNELSDEDQVVITVLPAPTDPIANAGPDQQLIDSNNDGTENVTLDGSGSSDPDGVIAEYLWWNPSLVDAPPVARGVSPTIPLSVGTHNLVLQVTDDSGATSNDQVVITILPGSDPPTANAGPDQQLIDSDNNGTEDVVLDGSASTSNNYITLYEWFVDGTSLGTGETLNLSLTVGTHEITLRVTDNNNVTNDDQVVITVLPLQYAPNADAGPDQRLTDRNSDNAEEVSLDGTGSSDPNGSIVSYEWLEFGTQIATGATPNITLGVGTHTLTLRVTDNDNLTDEDQVVITILPGPSAPTANAGPDQQLTDSDNSGSEEVVLDATGSRDSDGAITSYVWFEQGTRIATGETPAVELSVGDHTLTLRVTDNTNLISEDQVLISIAAGPSAPIADAGEDQTLTDTDNDGSEQVTLDASASSDADGAIVTYQWFEDGTQIASGETATITLPVGTRRLTLRVTDNDDLVGEDELVVSIATDTTTPIANAGIDQSLVDTDGDGSAHVTLDGTGSSDQDGTIISYTWYEGEDEIATGATPTVVLDEGTHTLTLKVMDDEGLTHQDQVTISVNGNHNQLEIVTGSGLTGSSGDTLGPFTVKLVDASGAPIANSPVTWRVIPENAATLSESETATDEGGQASTSMAIQQTGVIKLLATHNSTTAEYVINSIAETPGLTDTQQAVGSSMDNLCPSLVEKQASGELSAAEQDLLLTCENLVSESGTASTLSRLAPEEVAAQGTASIEAAATQLTNVNTRLVALRRGDTGMNISGLTVNYADIAFNQRLFDGLYPKKKSRGGGAGDIDELQGRWGAFINGNVNFGKKDETGRESGFDFDTTGITFGLDYRFNHQLVAGAALGLSRYDSDYNDAAGNLEMDAWSLSAYGTYYRDNSIYVDGLIQIGSNRYDTKRRINADGAPDQFGLGDTDGTEYAFNLSAGYEYRRNAWTLTPYGRLSYTRAEIDAYREEASNPAAAGFGSVLSIEDQELKSMVLVLGGNFSYTVSTASAVFMPQLRFELEHEFEDDSRFINARFVNDPTSTVFAVETDEADTDYFNLGIGLSAVFSQGRSAYIFYETRLNQDDVTLHMINAGLRIEF